MLSKFQQIDKRPRINSEFKHPIGKSPSKNIEEEKIKKSQELIPQKPDIKRADRSMDFRSIDNLKFNEKAKQKLNKSSHYISTNGMLYQLSTIKRPSIQKFID